MSTIRPPRQTNCQVLDHRPLRRFPPAIPTVRGVDRQVCLATVRSGAGAYYLRELTRGGQVKLVTHCGSGKATEFGELSFREVVS